MNIFLEKEFQNFIPEQYKSLIAALSSIADKNNIKIFLIGGVVRDIILGYPFKDIDFTVEADAVNFAGILKEELNCKIVSVQENLRTVKLEFDNGLQIDFASTREETYSAQGVLPYAFNFGCSLECDVKRRDFTINTLALSLCGKDKYKLIDYFNGFEDLKNKKIKVLHEKSFFDDPSRIVRALKFKMRLNFDIEEKTEKLIYSYFEEKHNSIPLERVKNELFQYFALPLKGLYKNIIHYKVYNLFNSKPIIKFNENNLSGFKTENLPFVFFTLLILNSKFEDERYKLLSGEKKILNEIKVLLNSKINKTDNFEIYKKYSEKKKLAIDIYYLITEDETVIKYQDKLKNIKVFITGNNLIDLGYKPSRNFAVIFDEILKEKLEGRIKTKEEEIAYIKKRSR